MSADDDDPLAPLADAYAEFLFGLWQSQQATANASASGPADAAEATTSGNESAIPCVS
jgi:hypothetical protein